MEHSQRGSMLKADYYMISGGGNVYKAVIIQGNNVIEEIDAVSEKQAHFLARRDYPEAKTPQEMQQLWDKDYYSKEGFAYRAKNSK